MNDLVFMKNLIIKYKRNQNYFFVLQTCDTKKTKLLCSFIMCVNITGIVCTLRLLFQSLTQPVLAV